MFWTDIDQGYLYRLNCGTGQYTRIYQSDMVGGFTLQDDGRLLLFREKDIALFDPELGRVIKRKPFEDAGSTRFNDTSAGPAGTCYAGTMGRSDESGGLFYVDAGGNTSVIMRGTGCANGMAFSPDRKLMYWTNTTTATIYVFDLDARSGIVTNPRVFLKVDSGKEGHPDGLTSDAEGNLYSARWAGGGVYMYSPAGAFLRKIELPVKNVTSAAFGGEDLKDLYISSAARGDDSADAGSLFVVRNDVPGMLEFRSRVEL